MEIQIGTGQVEASFMESKLLGIGGHMCWYMRQFQKHSFSSHTVA